MFLNSAGRKPGLSAEQSLLPSRMPLHPGNTPLFPARLGYQRAVEAKKDGRGVSDGRMRASVAIAPVADIPIGVGSGTTAIKPLASANATSTGSLIAKWPITI
jgi:hypothetical protein